MKRLQERAALQPVCRCLGYSRQAYYKRQARNLERQEQELGLLKAVSALRVRLPRVGGRKLHDAIQPKGYGRDRFFRFLRRHGLLICRPRSFRRTTWAGWVHYPNLLKDRRISAPGQAVVSDITYLETAEGFVYLFLTTDYYSRKILGWCLRRNLEAEGSLQALQMAIEALPNPSGCIHHSDRGLQYGTRALRTLTQAYGMKLSMTTENHVYQNAVAERLNGILKQEFLLGQRMISFIQAYKRVKETIEIYNNERFHNSLGRRTTPAKKFEEN